MQEKTTAPNLEPLNGLKAQIAIISAPFYREIIDGMLWGSQQIITEIGDTSIDCHHFEVSGAFEIAQIALKLGKTKKFDGILCLGAIVRGDTPHFDYICQATSFAIARVALKINRPVSFGVLTTDNLKQAQDRSLKNPNNKGFEAMLALLNSIHLNQQIEKTFTNSK